MWIMRKITLTVSLIAFIGVANFVAGVISTVSTKVYPSYGSIIFLDSKWRILTDKWKAGGYMIPYTGSLDSPVVHDIISVEDIRFYEHNGIDLYGKIASLWQNIQAWGIVRGGSTITEQYIKNTYYPWSSRTITQKIREWVAAIYIELRESKEDILRGYLDSIYFGSNTYGLASIERTFYNGKSLSDDDILDIITRINSPNIREDKKDGILAYRQKVQRRLGMGSDTTALFEKQSSSSIERYPLVTQRVLDGIRQYCSWDKWELSKWSRKIYGDTCTSPLLQVELSLDGDLMEYSRIALENILAPLAKKNVTNGAIYIYEPTWGKILAYIANRQSSTKWDNAIDMIQERRSVWSILKPFIYLLALDIWHDSNDFILDDTRIYPTGYSEKWFVPLNYIEKSYGPIRMREALWNSLNASTVRLSEELGIWRIYDFFRENGLALDHDAGYYGYGIALGGVELTLENIARAYGHLTDMTSPNLYLLDSVLKDSGNRAKTFGISSILNTSIPLAVKTGTSTDFRDNWAVSYSRDAVIGIWVGNSDATAMEDVSGVSGAWPLWHSIAEYMIARGLIRDNDTSPPPGLALREICLDRRCLQQELRLSKKSTSLRSRPVSKLYYESDFITRMTEEEKKKWSILSE